MFYSFIVFILLVVLSGGIAYLGDYIGRYLGKKRLSIFGLRPKHTAIVSTIVTGMVISFVVLLVLTTVNSEFREVVFHGKQIIENNKKLEIQSSKLIEEQKDLISKNKNLEKEHKSLKNTFSVLNKATKLLEDKNDKLSKKAKNFEIKSYNLSKKAVSLQNKVVSLSKAKIAAQESIKKLKNNILKQEKELKLMTGKSNDLSKQLIEKQSSLDANIIKLKDQEDNLKAIEGQLDEARNNLSEVLKSLEVANVELENYSQLRLNDVILRQDDEIIRGVIDKDLSYNEIENNLIKLIAAANIRCNDLLKHYTNNNKGLVLAFKAENGEVLLIDQKSLIKQAAEFINSNKKNDTLVLVSCIGNFTANDISKEPVVVQFKFIEDEIIFHKNDTVTNKYFDGKLTEPYVFSDVYDFINVSLLKTMEDAGIVFNQQIILKNNTKEVTNKIEILLNLTRQIKITDSVCLLSVKAKDNIYTHDIYSPELFDFEVKSIK